MYRRFGILAALVVAPLLSSRAAEAEEEQPIGHFPLVALIATVNTSFTPVVYSPVNFNGSLGPQKSESPQAFGMGPELRLRLDLDNVLLYGDWYYNFQSSGVVSDVHAGAVFGRQRGSRSTATLTSFEGTTYTATHRIDHYQSHTGKTLPVVSGLLLGANSTNVEGTVIDAIGIQPERRKPGGRLASIEAGYAVMSAQFEVIAAFQFEVTHQLPGLRWRVQYAFPLGPLPFYFHISGQHLFGSAEDNPLSTALSTGLGLGSGMGVSP